LDIDIGNAVNQTSDSGYIITGLRANQNVIDIIVIKTDKNGLTQVIGIEPINSFIPRDFKLYQNYPNPFNPTTKIKFDVAKGGEIKIILYDILGREIRNIVDENLKAGSYEINFKASNLSSGIYYYSLIAGGFRETNKMVLIK
jgi:Secretion system C-terminal sorting domain